MWRRWTTILTVLVAAYAGSVYAAPRTSPGSFLKYRANSVVELVRQVRSDRSIAAAYARHFGVKQSEIADYFARNLILTSLKKAQTVTVYFHGNQGKVIHRRRLLPAGTRVFATQSGKLILDWRCGNPLSTSLPPEPEDMQALKPGKQTKAPTKQPEKPAAPTPQVEQPPVVPPEAPTPTAVVQPEPVTQVLAEPPIEITTLPEVVPAVAATEPVVTAVTPPPAVVSTTPTAVPPIPTSHGGGGWWIPILIGGGIAVAGGGGGEGAPPPPEPPVPEPSAAASLAAAMAGMGWAALRQRRIGRG